MYLGSAIAGIAGVPPSRGIFLLQGNPKDFVENIEMPSITERLEIEKERLSGRSMIYLRYSIFCKMTLRDFSLLF